MNPSSKNEIIHATAVSINGLGVIIIGKSGSGKSDLALRLIDRGAVLVSDDRVIVEDENGRPMLSTAPNIEAMLEVRGIGILKMPHRQSAPLRVVVNLNGTPDRLPSLNSFHTIGEFQVPSVEIAAFGASAPLKVEHALRVIIDRNAHPVGRES